MATANVEPERRYAKRHERQHEALQEQEHRTNQEDRPGDDHSCRRRHVADFLAKFRLGEAKLRPEQVGNLVQGAN